MRTGFVSLLLFAAGAATAQAQLADLIVTHANVWTVDPARPQAEAVAVAAGRIVAVGTAAEIARMRTPATRVVDAGGRLVLPGFIDDHTHFTSGGFQLENVDLRQARDEQEFAAIIGKRARERPSRWITGGDWDHDLWKGGQLPHKALIDRLTPETPVFVNRYDGHMALANSYALKLAGVGKKTPDPPGGTIVRDPVSGEPTGILKDEAMNLVYRIIPDASREELADAALRALAEARRCGLTSIQDISSPADLAVYQALKAEGTLTARMYCRLPISLTDQLIATGIRVPFGDEWLRIGSLKAFADGSLGSSTALFSEPFTSDSSTHGLPSDIVIDGRLARWALEADAAHLQLSIHAIGDSANGLMLDMFESIVRTNPTWDRRFRLEHAQHLHASDFARFARLGVIASVQPYHAIDDGRWAEQRIGHERCRTTYAFRSFIDAGVKLCFGSDWTVAPLSPLLGIYAAVTRRTTDGANPGGWFPEQRISVEEAIQAYTVNNAYAAFEEKEKGSVTVGKLGDLVVLSDDILTIDPAKIESVKVDMTIVGGKIVYERTGIK
jgi:predicted amidohydrolase YtcJ